MTVHNMILLEITKKDGILGKILWSYNLFINIKSSFLIDMTTPEKIGFLNQTPVVLISIKST